MFRFQKSFFNYIFKNGVVEQNLKNNLNFFYSNNSNHGNSNVLNKYTFRSHTCGELSTKNLGENVCLAGWIKFSRLDKFICLSDKYGSIQLLIDTKFLKETFLEKNFKKFNLESVIIVKGIVCKRPENQIKINENTGEIEVKVTEIEFLNQSSSLPFSNKTRNRISESTKLKYQYLNIRSKKLQTILEFRSNFLFKIRNELIKNFKFIEVETPTLFKYTSGGANEFIIPTRIKDKFYTLTQSPQQFKQLLMIGSLDKYFQIAKCYRDEATRSNRQPEFTQLDLELSFTSSELVRKLIENLFQSIWPKNFENIQIPFQTITYKEAIENYGIDKPDIRLDCKIVEISNFAHKNIFNKNYLIIIKKGTLLDETNFFKINGIIKEKLKKYCKEEVHYNIIGFKHDLIEIDYKNCSFNEFENEFDLANLKLNTFLEKDDRIIYFRSNSSKLKKIIGQIRNEIIPTILNNKLVSEANNLEKEKYKFLWVIDFPLFNENLDGTIESNHHPFTAPITKHKELLYSDPLKTIGQHYDLVLNGNEIGGGSIRINNYEVQKYVFDSILKSDIKSMEYFLEALKFGCPPHGGIALGLDRLISIMLDMPSIRNVIAFPKTTNGKDLMSDAPNSIPIELKKLYNLH